MIPPEAIGTRRADKAAALARVLISHQADAETVAALPQAGRRAVEQLAGVPLSSDETWALVVALVGSPSLAQRLADVALDPWGQL